MNNLDSSSTFSVEFAFPSSLRLVQQIAHNFCNNGTELDFCLDVLHLTSYACATTTTSTATETTSSISKAKIFCLPLIRRLTRIFCLLLIIRRLPLYLKRLLFPLNTGLFLPLIHYITKSSSTHQRYKLTDIWTP